MNEGWIVKDWEGRSRSLIGVLSLRFSAGTEEMRGTPPSVWLVSKLSFGQGAARYVSLGIILSDKYRFVISLQLVYHTNIAKQSTRTHGIAARSSKEYLSHKIYDYF